MTNWRKVWRDFQKWIDEKTVGPVAWSRQKRQIQRLVEKHSHSGTSVRRGLPIP